MLRVADSDGGFTNKSEYKVWTNENWVINTR